MKYWRWKVLHYRMDISITQTGKLWRVNGGPLNTYASKTDPKFKTLYLPYLVELSSVQSQSCPALCDNMDCSMPGFPVHHQPLVFTETHLHWVSDVIQPSHPLSSLSPPAFNLSQHQGLFQCVSSLQQVVKVLEFQLQHQSFQWKFRTDLL